MLYIIAAITITIASTIVIAASTPASTFCLSLILSQLEPKAVLLRFFLVAVAVYLYNAFCFFKIGFF